ncbi:MAG: glycosyltransferase [Isosphaeraceae bacterium]
MDGKHRPWFSKDRRAAAGPARAPAAAVSRPPAARGGASSPPRILFINQYYWPDNASTAQHLADLAESLAARGFDCHVLCGKGAYKPGSAPLPSDEVHQGVKIHRAGATSLGRGSTLRRMADYLSFYANAAIRCATLPRFDVVVTLTTPPIIGLLGTLWRRFRGARHVSWSMDLHPDASVALGRMSPRDPVVRGLQWLSDLVYKQSDMVVALGPTWPTAWSRRGSGPAG